MASPAPSSSSPATRRNGTGASPATIPHFRVAILGAGFGGLGMAIQLLQHGVRDFVVLERADEVGGTWRDNTYPGCQCDVASNMYSYSFAPNPGWSRDYAWQGEILDYIKDCTERYGVRPHIRFEHEVLEARYDAAQQRWAIRTSQGELSADVLVSGHGALSAPSVPELPGIEKFKGTVFHSAAWNHEHSLKGERVAVLGTGASAIQVVPSIQPEVGKLTLFQRTAPWIVPRNDGAWSEQRQALYRRLPFLQKLDRMRIYLMRELVVLGMRNPDVMRRGEVMAKQHLHEQIKDKGLRKKLTPNYRLGCKRILISDNYYPALAQPNVEVVTEGVRECTERGLVTKDGVHHEVDTIILCTGFKVQDHPVIHRLRGRDGRTLAEHWEKGGTGAYAGTTVPGFPNLFVLTGPYTGLGHNSMLYMLEAQFTYVVKALEAMTERNAGSVEVRPEAMAAFDQEMQEQLKGTVWTSGCASWYLDNQGRASGVWPTFTWRYKARTRSFDTASYVLEPRQEQHRQASPATAQLSVGQA
jgi:cation diffusion facilitator CzcD-associated flavoprotein CzcO